MRSTRGKVISFMENVAGWHGKAPYDEQLAQGLAELAVVRRMIEGA